MTAPSYTTDLTSVNNAESGTWIELPGFTGGTAPVVGDTDYFIQNVGCTTQAYSKTGSAAGMQYDYGSNITLSTDDCFFVWQVYLAANAIDTWANGGLRFGCGGASGGHNLWNALGSDAYRNPYGGWWHSAIDPTFTADQTIGTPGSTYRYFASKQVTVSSVAKGNVHGVDEIRYGRGDFIVEYGEIANYATVAGMATTNDATASRWGLMQKQPGGYLWKGLWSLGTTTNAVDFRDANRSIIVQDTPRTYSYFNSIEVVNASSRVDWTGFTISGPEESPAGTILSKGQFEAVDNADINWDTCVFVDLSTFILQSNTTALTCTWRRCGIVTQGGATLTGCTFDSSAETHALLATNPGVISSCNWISGGSGHGIRCDTIGTYTWSANTDTGYTGTRGSNLVSSSGSTDALFYNNSGGLITLNVTSGGQQPSVRNGAGATTQVNANVAITYTGLVNGSEVRVYNTGTSTEIDGIESVTGNQFGWSVGSGVGMDIVILGPTPTPAPDAIAYIPIREVNASFTADTSVGKTQLIDRNYRDAD